MKRRMPRAIHFFYLVYNKAMPSQSIAGRFLIADPQHDLLGSGGMGAVYLGRDLESGEPVAIKMLKPEFVGRSPDIVARFQREGELLRQLNHPNIVRRIAALEEAGNYYLVEEYAPGGSLADLLGKEGKLALRQALKIALELADALSRMHHLGIVHRDLKPANVLLAADGTPRLTDFGVARLEAGLPVTQSGQLLGTLDYLSPEACQGLPLDGRADIWAFGVLLFEMLAGYRPFRGENVAATLSNILGQPTPDLQQLRPDLPVAVVDLVYRLLEKDPLQRIPSMRLAGGEIELLLRAAVPGGAAISPVLPVAAPLPAMPEKAEHQHNLPSQTTAFVGREAELLELERLLDDPQVRLITIVGPGGMGKTRLGLELARRCLERTTLAGQRFNDGIFFVSLAPLRVPEEILATLAEAISLILERQMDPKTQALNYLRDKRMLLLFDNFEHLLPGALLVSEILQTASGIQALTTTRQRLNVQGEYLLHLEGMDFPDWETPQDAQRYSAVQLFLQSARRVCPEFELQESNLKYVARICRLVGGMPLGILLAAAWLEMFSPQEVADEISRSLDFLESEQRDLPERQRSIRAVFDYSLNLLSAEEREVFSSLGVFRGGFTRQAAQEAVEAGLRTLIALVNKSLLQRTPSSGRYEMHELLRQYAEEKLDASAEGGKAVRDRHAAYYARCLEGWQPRIKGAEQRQARTEIEVEYKNIQVAWEWSAAQRHLSELAQGLQGMIWFCWIAGRNADGEKAMALACQAARPDAAIPETLLPPARRLLALALGWQAYIRYTVSELEWPYLREAQEILRELEEQGVDVRVEKANLLYFVAQTHDYHGDREKARPAYQESLALFEELANSDPVHRREYLFDCGYTLESLSYIFNESGDYAAARRLLERSMALRREVGDYAGLAEAMALLGSMTSKRGRIGEAVNWRQQALALAQSYGGPSMVAYCKAWLGEALGSQGDYAAVSALLGQAAQELESLGMHGAADSIRLHHFVVELHRGNLEQIGDLSYSSSNNWIQGYGKAVQAMTALYQDQVEEAGIFLSQSLEFFTRSQSHLDQVFVLFQWAYAERLRSRPESARQKLTEALQIAQEFGNYPVFLASLPAVALLLADDERLEQAAELEAWAWTYGYVANSRWFEKIAGEPLKQALAALDPERREAARQRGLERAAEFTRNLNAAGAEAEQLLAKSVAELIALLER